MAHKRPTEIEQTSKRWKLLRLIAVLVIIFSAVLICASLPEKGGQPPYTGMIFLVVGVVLFSLSRFGAWWHHG